jgi:hypothetical protein
MQMRWQSWYGVIMSHTPIERFIIFNLHNAYAAIFMPHFHARRVVPRAPEGRERLTDCAKLVDRQQLAEG